MKVIIVDDRADRPVDPVTGEHGPVDRTMVLSVDDAGRDAVLRFVERLPRDALTAIAMSPNAGMTSRHRLSCPARQRDAVCVCGAEDQPASPAAWVRWFDNLTPDERETAAKAIIANSLAAHRCTAEAHDRWLRQMRDALILIRSRTEQGLRQ